MIFGSKNGGWIFDFHWVGSKILVGLPQHESPKPKLWYSNCFHIKKCIESIQIIYTSSFLSQISSSTPQVQQLTRSPSSLTKVQHRMQDVVPWHTGATIQNLHLALETRQAPRSWSCFYGVISHEKSIEKWYIYLHVCRWFCWVCVGFHVAKYAIFPWIFHGFVCI